LAGGTVDIWPIYLFLKKPLTLNLGIDLFAECEIIENASRKIVLKAQDQGREAELTWDQMDLSHQEDALPPQVPPQLELHFKFLRHFSRELEKTGKLDRTRGIEMKTLAKSPAGAGLGGSSALSVAMIGALASWAKGSPFSAGDIEREGERNIEITRDVETTVIHVPAGLQDYYGAMFGGLQSLKWRTGANSREKLPADLLPEVEKRLLLFYSGQSRNSGINNWALFKAFIDKQDRVRERFSQIVKATQDLEAALRAKDFDAASDAIAREWEIRRTLASGISTPEMDTAFAKAKAIAASKGEKISGKICGAGGGGCFFLFLPSGNPELRAEIESTVGSIPGLRPLPFKAVPEGLTVQTRS
jgi:D-glycero-alpha-D-manno-heptose-7-phosphate kinase